jgi:hypothetical protein
MKLKNLKIVKQTSYPTIRKVRVDDQGKPIEVIEEPAFISRDDSKEFWKMIYEIREKDNQTIQQIVRETKEMINMMLNKFTEQLREIDSRRTEEIAKLREEIYKKEIEYTKQLYEREVEDLKSSIDSIKRYYDEKMNEILNDLKREWEYKLKLMELEQSKGLRDVIVSEIRETSKEFREATKDIRESLTDYMKQILKSVHKPEQKQVPQVSEEEKKKILEALKKKVSSKEERKEEGVKEEKKEKEESEKIMFKMIGRES